MSARISQGRFAPEKSATNTETALPAARSGQHVGKKLSGAFTAVLGDAPHPGRVEPNSRKGADALKPVSAASDKLPVKNSRPGAPKLPGKGHR